MIKKKIFFIPIIFFAIGLYSSETINYAISDKHAFLLPKHKATLIFEYQKLNDTLDIFNIKAQELGSLSSYGSIGDMSGYNLEGRYSVSDTLMGSLKLGKEDVAYGSGALYNETIDGYMRYQLTNSSLSFVNATSLDIGYVLNRASTMSYDDPKFLEPLATKVLDVKKTVISQNSDGTYTIGVLKKDGTTNLLSNLKQKPTLYIDGMRDDSLYIRAIAEKRINPRFYISAFAKFSRTKIKTLVTANSELIAEAKKQNYDIVQTLDRYESSISAGWNISLNFDKLAWELTYTYSKIFRDSSLGYIDYNHIIDATVAKPIGKHWIVYMGAKLMYRQFNAEIPYLYNKYTQTTFDHKYGYARFGVEYRF